MEIRKPLSAMLTWVLLSAALIQNSFAHEKAYRHIGFDEQGTEMNNSVDAKEFDHKFRAILGSVSDTALPVLNRRTSRGLWQIRTIVVGIGLGAEFGVGPILKVKATPRMRIVFSKSADPVLP